MHIQAKRLLAKATVTTSIFSKVRMESSTLLRKLKTKYSIGNLGSRIHTAVRDMLSFFGRKFGCLNLTVSNDY